MGLGENIKKFRIAYGMDQKELGKALNVSDKTISSWECGRTEPKMGMVEKVAEVFGVKKTDIVEGQVYETYSNPEAFEYAWHKAGGGRHPIQLSDHEYELVISYRYADKHIQNSIDMLLKINSNKRRIHISSAIVAPQVDIIESLGKRPKKIGRVKVIERK
mgnify:CR=1 FL=1